MFDLPTKGDIDRKLSTISHAAHHKAQADCSRLTNEAIAHGAFLSTRLIISVANSIDKIHIESLAEAVPMLHEFVLAMKENPKQIAAWARPHLENMANTLLGIIPAASFPVEQQKFRMHYAAIFQQRLNGALRDFEIGFIGGKRIDSSVHLPSSQKEIVSLKPGVWGVNVDLKELWRRLNSWTQQKFLQNKKK